jgi:hypothetical protein
MQLSAIYSPLRLLPLLVLSAAAQTPASPAPATPANTPPVAYSSVSQLNMLLSQLEQTSQTAQLDLAKLRVDKWKTDSNTKRQEQANVESLSRNLHSALPEIIAELRNSPENLTSTFKLYRNLDAVYDVFGSLVESTGAFGPKDDFQSLENDLTAMEKSRRAFADRMETLSGAKEVELTRLRSQLQAAQAAIPAAPPKKVIVDDTEPPKKSSSKTKKKTTAKPATPPSTSTPPQ